MDKITIKVITRKELADQFGINRKTLYRWFKSENIKIPPRLITPKQLKIIYEKFGDPKSP